MGSTTATVAAPAEGEVRIQEALRRWPPVGEKGRRLRAEFEGLREGGGRG